MQISFISLVFLLMGALSSESRTVYSVDTYGASPNDGQHDGQAIRNCIAAAIADGGPTEVRFSSGVYDCSINGTDPVFEIEGANDLWLNGTGTGTNGTELLFYKNAQTSINVEGCTNVVLKNFSVDYKYLPFTQGTVSGVGSNYVDVALDSGFPDFSETVFNIGDNKQLHRMELVGSDWMRQDTLKADFSYEYLGGSSWRIQPKAIFLSSGDRFVLKSRVGGFSSVVRDSVDCAYENVTFYCGLSFTTLGANTTRLRYTDCNWTIRPGTTRMMGPIADCIHSLGNRGGLIIDGCTFKGQGDDAINMHSREAAITQVISSSELKIQTHNNFELRLNDWISVMDMDSGTEKGKKQITAISFDGDIASVTLNNAISNMSTDDKVFSLTASGCYSVVKNCSISSGRLLIRGHHVTVTNNTFSLGGFLAFRISPDYPEGPIPYQAIVEKNIFDYSTRSDYQVFANVKTADGGPSGSKIWGLTFSNNEFYDASGISIFMKNVEDIIFTGESQKIDVAVGVPESARSLIILDDYSDIEFDDMTFIDPNSETVNLVRNTNGDTVQFIGCDFTGLYSNTTICTGLHSVE